MKKFSGFFLGALVLAGFMAAFLLGNALAATGCFSDTNGHWAEAYICWLKDNGISTGYADGTFKPNNNITRAEMAAMLQRANAVPPQNGLVLFSAANTNVVAIGTDPQINAKYNIGSTEFSIAAPAYRYLMVNPDFAPVLYGKSLQFTGVEICYSNSNTTINRVVIGTILASSSLGDPVFNYTEDVIYADTNCRYFALPAPYMMNTESGVFITIGVDFLEATSVFKISRTTFVFQPTATSAVAPASMSANKVTLSESSADLPFSIP